MISYILKCSQSTSTQSILSPSNFSPLNPSRLKLVSRSIRFTMITTFKEINSDSLRCSAWLKDKDRCCQRKIGGVDRRRKLTLLRSFSFHQAFIGEESSELVDLYLCNGWHRSGGKHPLSSPERHKILQLLFPNPLEPTATFEPAPSVRQQSLRPHVTQEEATRNLSESERLSFPLAESAVRFFGGNFASQSEPPVPAPMTISTEIEPQPVDSTSHEHLFLQPRTQTARASSVEASSPNREQRNADATSRAVVEDRTLDRSFTPMENQDPPVETRQNRQTSRSGEGERGLLPQVAVPMPRRSARLQTQQPEALPQVAVPMPRRSARLQAQQPEASPQVTVSMPRRSAHLRSQPLAASLPPITQSQQNTPTEPVQVVLPPPSTVFEHEHGVRGERYVNLDDKCPICDIVFDYPTTVSRCNVCKNDLHTICMLKWLTTPGSSLTCTFWYVQLLELTNSC